MIAFVHSIYSQSVHAPALNAGLMDNDAERYCKCHPFNIRVRGEVLSIPAFTGYLKLPLHVW